MATSPPLPALSEDLLTNSQPKIGDSLPIATSHSLPSPFHLTTPTPELLTQGAEALVYRTHFLDSSTPAALKFRPSKPYRHPTLDARLTKQRVLAEARILVKLSGLRVETKEGGVGLLNVPAVLGLEWDVGRKVKGLNQDVVRVRNAAENTAATSGAWLLMEWIDGKSVKQILRDCDEWHKTRGNTITEEERIQAEDQIKLLLRRIGKAVGAMHSKGGVVHGDLTSSNIMVRPVENKLANGDSAHHEENQHAPNMNGEIVLIDFGLATQSIQDEDRAVDLYVLERAFGSTHPKQEGWFDAEVLQHQDGYKSSFKGANVVLKRLEEVRLRGRKRSMIG